MRRGQIHSVEAVIATLLFLFFTVTILPQLTDSGETAPPIKQELQHVVSTLDDTGRLRGPATRGDAATVKQRVENHVTGRPIEVILLTLNTTASQETFSSTHSRVFGVNNTTVQRQELRVWFRNAVAPNISINDQYITNNTGTVSARSETFDISGATQDGDNTMTIEVDGRSRVGYSIEILDQMQTGTAPTNVNVFSAPYLVSGANHTLTPTEVTVLSWQ